MTIGSVPITVDLDGIDKLLGEIGKQTIVTTITNPIVNSVSVAVADPTAVGALDGIEASDAASVTVYGPSGRQLVTILANTTQAASLAEYLVRPNPEYWFSSIEVLLNAIPAGDQDAVAELEIGSQIRVSKRFPNVTNPVVQDLFVEGVEHEVSADRHVVRLYCSPASLYRCFVLDASDLDDTQYGLATVGASCSLNTPTLTGEDSLTLIQVDGEPYWVADWKASGTIEFHKPTEVEYLVVAGGGGGGQRLAGGGGAGGLLTGQIAVSAQAYTVTVGAGGAGSAPSTGSTTNLPSAGSNSSFSSVTAIGGGRGSGSTNTAGGAGGSGGGGRGNQAGAGGAGTSGQGNNGGAGGSGTSGGGGGGGGAGAVGANGGATTGSGGNGGDGVSSSITGTAVTYAGGGGGGQWLTRTRGLGGAGGGGDAGQESADPSVRKGGDGVDGLGGGGGVGMYNSSDQNGAGGDGGDGRVILRWKVYAD